MKHAPFAASIRRAIVLGASCLAVQQAPASAQDVIWEWGGVRAQFGAGLDGAGDLDGDGFGEILIGTPNALGLDRGRVQVYSGKDGVVLHEIPGPTDHASFGRLVSAVGDLNLDGANEFVATAETGGPDGSVWVYSGRDSSLIRSIPLTTPDGFSKIMSLKDAGDVNKDGTPDILVSAVGDPGDLGTAWVLSGATGQTIHLVQGPDAPSRTNYGLDSAALGDLNADGHADFAVLSNPAILIYSGLDASILRETEVFHDFESLTSLGDITHDGLCDYAVAGDHLMRAYSGRTGSFIYERQNDGTRFGFAMASASDLFTLVAAPEEEGSGFVYLYSSRNEDQLPALLYKFKGIPGSEERFGRVVASAGDVNGDGALDFAVSARHRVVVYSGNDVYLQPNKTTVTEGKRLRLTSRTVRACNAGFLFLTALNGVPTSRLIAIGSFWDPDGFVVAARIPTGLSGLELEFQTFGDCIEPGIAASDKVVVTIE